MTYNDFLTTFNVLTEEEFNDFISYFPENIDVPADVYVDGNLNDLDWLSEVLVNGYLSDNAKYAYVDDIDFEKKTFAITDVNSEEELQNILKDFPKWKLTNEEEIRQYLTEEEENNEEEKRKQQLLETLDYNFDEEELKELINYALKKYGK